MRHNRKINFRQRHQIIAKNMHPIKSGDKKIPPPTKGSNDSRDHLHEDGYLVPSLLCDFSF